MTPEGKKRGFVIVMVLAFLTIILLMVTVVVNIGLGEIFQTRIANDYASAYYAASSGAEMLYAFLKSKENETVTWPQVLSGTINTNGADGQTVGSYAASANTVASEVFGIVSEGVVNGKKSKITVRYGFSSPITNGIPIGSAGPMELYGRKGIFGLRSWVRADGPLESGSTITTNNYVQVSGDVLPDQEITAPSFWLGAQYDTNNDGDYLTDVTGDGMVTVDDAGGDPGKITVFNNDNAYSSDAEINDKDAFYYYYTIYLNDPANNNLNQNLGIGEGEAHYYPADQSFDPWTVPAGTPIVFVNGNADIMFNDTSWWGGSSDHVVVAMGNINIVQPTNGSDDRLTLIAYNDVNTGGVIAFGGIRGEIVVYANGSFNAYYGGRANGTILAKDSVYVDTVIPIPGLLNRDLKKGSDDWSDPSTWPLGLPPGYATVSLSFVIKDETKPEPQGYIPRWQRD